MGIDMHLVTFFFTFLTSSFQSKTVKSTGICNIFTRHHVIKNYVFEHFFTFFRLVILPEKKVVVSVFATIRPNSRWRETAK